MSPRRWSIRTMRRHAARVAIDHRMLRGKPRAQWIGRSTIRIPIGVHWARLAAGVQMRPSRGGNELEQGRAWPQLTRPRPVTGMARDARVPASCSEGITT
jgi:hypothetical protein